MIPRFVFTTLGRPGRFIARQSCRNGPCLQLPGNVRAIKNQPHKAALAKDSDDLQEKIKGKKSELQEFIETKRSELHDRMEEKRDQLQNTLESGRNDMKDYIEDTKIDLRERLHDTSNEIYKKRKEAKTWIILSLASRSIEYLKNYTFVLKEAFPNKLIQTYRVFSTGTKQLTQDMKTYARIKDTLVNSIDKGKSHAALSSKEYEVFISLPNDAMRVAPVLLISALPFAQNVVFPLALLYPKLFLSSHFLTHKQREEVMYSYAKKQQEVYPRLKEELIRCTDLTYEVKPELVQLRNILNSGRPLSKEEILDLRPLFELGGPLDIRHLTRRHDKLLAAYHRVWYLFFPYKHLERYANLLWRMDQALLRENLDQNTPSLTSLASQRGLNSCLYGEAETLQYIKNWLEVSKDLRYKDISLLLHLPLFLANKSLPAYHQ